MGWINACFGLACASGPHFFFFFYMPFSRINSSVFGGFVEKRSRNKLGWNGRYVTFDGHVLRVYNDSGLPCKKEINVKNAKSMDSAYSSSLSCILSEGKERFPISVVDVCNKKIVFSCDSEEERDEYLDLLNFPTIMKYRDLSNDDKDCESTMNNSEVSTSTDESVDSKPNLLQSIRIYDVYPMKGSSKSLQYHSRVTSAYLVNSTMFS